MWAPVHLAQSLDTMLRDGARAAQDVVEYVDYVPARGESQNRLRRRWSAPASEATIAGGVEPQLSSFVMERSLLEEAGGFDPGLHRGAVTAMLL